MSSGSVLALGRKAERRAAGAGDAAAAVDERIEHQAEELVRHLECRPAARRSRPRRRAGVSALPRLPPVRPKTLTKPGGSAPPLLKKLLSASATLLLVLAQRAAYPASPERRGQIQDHVGRGVAEARREARRQAWRGQAVEPGAAAAARRRQDGVGARDVAAGPEHRLHGAGERRGAGDIGAVGLRGRDLDDVGRGRRQHQVALHRERADRVAGRERAAVDGGRCRSCRCRRCCRRRSP